MTEAPEWDLIVVGGGGCGLAGAIAAAEGGAQVLVLERAAELGGNTARSIGSVPGAGTRFQAEQGVEDDPERFTADLRARTGGRGDPEATRLMCGISAELVHWLVDDVGVPLRLTMDYKHVAHSVNRLHNPPSREGAEVIAAMERRARDLGVTISLDTSVSGLAMGSEQVTIGTGPGGADDWDRADRLTGSAVLLATDGFGGAPDLVEEHCGPAGRLAYFGAPTNTGDGLRWGRELGAAAAHLGSYLGFAVMAVPPDDTPTYDTLFSWTIPEVGGIAVDRTGRRFGNEDEGYSAFSDRVLEDADGACVVVFDQRMLDHVTQHEPRFARLVARSDSPVVAADDVDALATALGLDPTELRRSIAGYAEAARHERPDDFGRITFGLAPLEGRLYGCPTRPGILTTQGGLVVDRHARVVLDSGDLLHRVYAGGGTAAGISGDRGAQGYASGNGLLTALGYGMLAGRHVASTLAVSA